MHGSNNLGGQPDNPNMEIKYNGDFFAIINTSENSTLDISGNYGYVVQQQAVTLAQSLPPVNVFLSNEVVSLVVASQMIGIVVTPSVAMNQAMICIGVQKKKTIQNLM